MVAAALQHPALSVPLLGDRSPRPPSRAMPPPRWRRAIRLPRRRTPQWMDEAAVSAALAHSHERKLLGRW
jgi:hypothetical protein